MKRFTNIHKSMTENAINLCHEKPAKGFENKSNFYFNILRLI